MLQCVAVRWCVAVRSVRCSTLQCVAVFHLSLARPSGLEWAVSCSLNQCFVAVLQCVAVFDPSLARPAGLKLAVNGAVFGSFLQFVEVLQCVVVFNISLARASQV